MSKNNGTIFTSSLNQSSAYPSTEMDEISFFPKINNNTCLFYKHSVFQSEARICLSFSQIEPQNMLKICLT